MADDPTKDLTDGEKLSLILINLSGVETRLATFEAQAEDRSRETRPKLDLIIKEISDLREGMADIRKDLRSIDRKFDVFNKDMLAMKADLRDFDERLTELERRPN